MYKLNEQQDKFLRFTIPYQLYTYYNHNVHGDDWLGDIIFNGKYDEVDRDILLKLVEDYRSERFGEKK